MQNMGANCTLKEIAGLVQKTNGSEIPETELKHQLISDELKYQLDIYLLVTAFIITSLLGITSNTINILVYWKQGLKDSITVGFFALSLSDLFLVIMPLMAASCYAAKMLLPDSDIDFPSLHYVTSASYQKMGYSLSCVFTAFLSLERCYCVVMPFKVKVIFTRRRTATILVSIFVFHVICYVPFFVSQGLRWVPKQTTNGTLVYRLKVYFTYYRYTVEQVNYILMGIFIPTATQIVVTICVVVLINGLRASSRFRNVVATSKTRVQASGKSNAKHESKESSRKEITTESNPGEIKDKNGVTESLTHRDARLVKTMIFLVVILSASNVPLLMVTYAQRIVPDLDILGAYQNTYSVCYSIIYILSTLNASANMVVYYTTSTKYRDVLKTIMCCKKFTGPKIRH